jgi:hypothetical protein
MAVIYDRRFRDDTTAHDKDHDNDQLHQDWTGADRVHVASLVSSLGTYTTMGVYKAVEGGCSIATGELVTVSWEVCLVLTPVAIMLREIRQERQRRAKLLAEEKARYAEIVKSLDGKLSKEELAAKEEVLNFNPNMKPKAVNSIDSTEWRTMTWVDRLAACKVQELQSNSSTGSDADTDTALKFQNPLLDDDDNDDEAAMVAAPMAMALMVVTMPMMIFDGNEQSKLALELES